MWRWYAKGYGKPELEKLAGGYNFAVQQAAELFFKQYRSRPDQVGGRMRVGDWLLSANLSDLYPRELTPRRASELMPASRLTFQGIRSIYRRDGLGADLVIATDGGALGTEAKSTAPLAGSYSEMPYRPVTAIIAFAGNTLAEVLHTQEATLLGYDPYQHETLDVHDIPVPLAANFTSAYGLWLARSDFSTQALRNVLGKSGSLDAPYVYLTQPFDPDRQVIVMLHGLASSPEAWINVANEVMGGEELRKRYQVWQVYYPTNAPIAYNHASIRAALAATFQHFDPTCAAQCRCWQTVDQHRASYRSYYGAATRRCVGHSRCWQVVKNDIRGTCSYGVCAVTRYWARGGVSLASRRFSAHGETSLFGLTRFYL